MADYLRNTLDLKHDPELAAELGNMVVAWATAETTLMFTLACVLDADLNQLDAGYYRIPTFEARTKFIRELVLHWKTKEFDKDAIAHAVTKLAKLSATRNGWIHGGWYIAGPPKRTVIIDFRTPMDSPDRVRPVKAGDVKGHNDAVKRRSADLMALIWPWTERYFRQLRDQGHPQPLPPENSDPSQSTPPRS